jgi:hypothetical protein
MKAAAVALAAGLAAPAFAAGGHHAVDDAAILDAGQCEVESWFGRSRGGEKLLHAGAGCRVGPVELGAAAEYARQPGASQTGWQLQAKWAAELAGNLSVGVSLAPSWAAHARPRYQGATVAALATWKVGDAVALHANLGRDLVHRGDDASRSGVAAEWSPAAAWTLLLERYTEERGHFVRAGARWALRESFSVDLSRAHRLSGAGDSGWTLGVTWLLER